MEPFSALLISNDAGTLTLTNKIFDEYGVKPDLAMSRSEADACLQKTKFDLIVYDNDIPGAMELAGNEPAAHAPNVVFALIRGQKVADLRGKRVHFVVPKPFSADLFARSLKAAYSVMVKEKRAAFRHSVLIRAVNVNLAAESGRKTLENVRVMDLSQTGIGIRAMEALPKGASIQVSFHLPEKDTLVHTVGTIMWADSAGRAGVKFTHVPPMEQAKLVTWLNTVIPWDSELSPKVLLQ